MSTPIEETVRFLNLYNKWRRDEDETILMPDPHDIGNAIDSAVSLLESIETANAELAKKVEDLSRRTTILHKTADGLGACLIALGVEEDMFNDPPSMHEWCEKRGAEYADLRAKVEKLDLQVRLADQERKSRHGDYHAALEDKARLDWLEANHADIDWYRDDNRPVYEVRVDGPVAAYAKSIRAAIDAARKEGAS